MKTIITLLLTLTGCGADSPAPTDKAAAPVVSTDPATTETPAPVATPSPAAPVKTGAVVKEKAPVPVVTGTPTPDPESPADDSPVVDDSGAPVDPMPTPTPEVTPAPTPSPTPTPTPSPTPTPTPTPEPPTGPKWSCSPVAASYTVTLAGIPDGMHMALSDAEVTAVIADAAKWPCTCPTVWGAITSGYVGPLAIEFQVVGLGGGKVGVGGKIGAKSDTGICSLYVRDGTYP